MRITVIGAGTMGNGIVHLFAQNGFSVNMVDISQERLDAGLTTISSNLDRIIKKELITIQVKEKIISRINLSTKLDEISKVSDLIIEAANENFEIKSQIFKTIDDNAPVDAILATNTSSISITKIAAKTSRPDKVIGMHFFNPVPIMKLVEIIRGYSTSQEVFNTIKELSEKVGKVPVEVHDFPGFVSNRVLMPMINEAIFCVMEGVASIDDIDTVMKLGMAHPMGPLALADFIGLDVCLAIMEVLHTEIGDSKYRPSPLLKKMVSAGFLGKKQRKDFMIIVNNLTFTYH